MLGCVVASWPLPSVQDFFSNLPEWLSTTTSSPSPQGPHQELLVLDQEFFFGMEFQSDVTAAAVGLVVEDALALQAGDVNGVDTRGDVRPTAEDFEIVPAVVVPLPALRSVGLVDALVG